MRRVRLPLIAVLLPLALVAASGCGVTADTSAATVAGETVSADTVNELARDTDLLSALSISCSAESQPAERQSDSVVSGCAARGALSFEIERTAWIAEAERFGVPIDAAARKDAQSQLESDTVISAMQPATRKLIVDYVAAQSKLTERFATLDDSSDADLRLLYDGIPNYWDRVCFSGLSVSADGADDVTAALGDGTSLEDVPAKVEAAEQIADSSSDCIPESSFPTELRTALDATPTGEVTSGVAVAASDGTSTVYFLRIDRHEHLSFDQAKSELVPLVAQLVPSQNASQGQSGGPSAWIQLVVQNAEITPRYGSGMSADSSGRLTVDPPPVPILPSNAPVAASTASGTGAGADSGQ